MADITFYRCEKCGNLLTVIKKGTCVPQCCGDPMTKLEAGSVDAAAEKHVPAITREGGNVNVAVGEVAHPMLDAHYIEWIALSSADRLDIRYLHPGDAPEASFACDGSAEVSAYAYCNLHGLWKAQA